MKYSLPLFVVSGLKSVGRLRLGLLGAALGALMALVWAASWALDQRYASDVERTLVAGERSAHKLAVRASQVLDQVNQTTRLVKALHESHNAMDLDGLRHAGLVAFDVTKAIYVTDARGFVVATTSDSVPANIGDEAEFKRHRRSNDLGMTVGVPIVDHLLGGSVIPVMQSLTAADGIAFSGVVVALIDPSILTKEYAFGEAPGTAVSILGHDNVVRSRMLDGELSNGSTLDAEKVKLRAQEGRTTLKPSVSPIDKQARFVSIAPVERYPFSAIVAVSASPLLHKHAQRRLWVMSMVATLAGLLAVGTIFMWRQATLLERSRATAKEAHAMYQGTMDGSLDAVVMLRPVIEGGRLVDCTIVDANRVAAQWMGTDRSSLIGADLCKLLPTARQQLGAFWRASTRNETTVAELQAAEAAFAGRWFQFQVVPVAGGIVGLLARDVTDRVKAQEQLEQLARVDSLTGLANRRCFEERLEESMRRASRQSSSLAVIYLDLDGFKSVNDLLGHEAGDVLLVEVARRLKMTMRGVDVVARLGGDEFAVLLEGLGDPEDLSSLCERLVDILAKAHTISGRSIVATPSVGVALWDEKDSGVALLKRADEHMYMAKRAGKACYRMAPAALP